MIGNSSPIWVAMNLSIALSAYSRSASCRLCSVDVRMVVRSKFTADSIRIAERSIIRVETALVLITLPMTKWLKFQNGYISFNDLVKKSRICSESYSMYVYTHTDTQSICTITKPVSILPFSNCGMITDLLLIRHWLYY